MTILATDDSWRIVTDEGELVPVRIKGGDVQVGQPKGEIVQAPFSSAVFLAKGDGEWESRRIPIDFLVVGRDVLDKFGARAEETALRSALRYPVGLYGARSKEGLYLPLRGALPNGDPLEDEPGQRVLPYELIAASVKDNTLERGWEYPVLDGVSAADAQTVLIARQAKAGFPVLLMNGASRWSSPLTFSRMTQGTLAVGYLLQGVGAFPLLSLGLPGDGAASQSLVYDTGSFTAHAGTGSLTVTQDQLGGFGYPAVLGATLIENGMLNLYSFSRLGFQAHGTVPVGTILPYASQRVYLGASATGPSLNGVIFPGAPKFAMPAFTHRVMPVEEIKESLGLWYQEIYRQPAFSADPPPYGLALTLPEFPDIVAGQTDTIAFTVTREGGYLGNFDFDESASDDPAIRISFSRQEEDGENPGGETTETWVLTRVVEEAAVIQEHTIKVVARAEGWTADGPLAVVTDEDQRSFQVRATAPALAPAKSAHTFYSPQALDFAVLRKDVIASTYTFNLRGLGRWSGRGDAAYFDGTDIAPYGKTYGEVDDAISMAAPHARAVGLWNVKSAPVNTVFCAFASKSMKGDYWQLYRGATGLHVRLTGGGGTNVVDTPALPVTDGVMHVAVRVTPGGNLELINAETGDFVIQSARAWVGNGLFTAFAMKQSDGTITGLSKGTLLYQVGHDSAPTNVQLERQAAHMATFMLRTAQWERPEFPDGTDYIFEALAGEIFRNRHPATQSICATLTAVGSPTTTSDSWKTNGSSQAVHTPLLNRGIQSPNEAVIAIRNFHTGGQNISRAQMSMTAQNASALYIRASRTATTSNRRLFDMVAPGGGVASTESATVLAAGDHTFGLRFRAGKVEFEHIASGEIISGEPADASQITGALVYGSGAVKRQDSTTQLQSYGATEWKGFVLGAKEWTPAERKVAMTILNTTYDYSSAPAGGVGGGTTPAPTITAFTASPASIDAGSSATLAYTIGGAYTSLIISGVGAVTASSGSGSVVVSPTTTTTYTLTASNGSASSTAQVTVVVNGTGGGSSSMDFSRLSPQMNPNYSINAYAAGSQQRAYADIVEKAVLKTYRTITDNMSGRNRVPLTFDGTYEQLEAKQGDPAWTDVGQYSTARFNSIGFGNMCWLARISSDPRWIKKIAEMATYYLLLHDRRGSPDSVRGWRELGYSPTFGMIYGFQSRNKDGSIAGTNRSRSPLEQGCGLSGPMHAAYLLYMNRALDGTGGYEELSHRLRAMWVNHTMKVWDEYQDKRDDLYASDGVTRLWPESVRRKFVHPDLGEHSCLAHWALLETAIYNSGQTGAISVLMKGEDFASTQYSGAMIDVSGYETLGLAVGTSANVTTHPGWKRAVKGFKNLAESKTNVLMTSDKIVDTVMAARVPDGTLVWGQFNYGAGATGGTAAAPTSYNNESLEHLFVLRAEGVMSEALGSDANADLYMRRVAGRDMVGPLADTPTTGKVANASLGIIDTRDANGNITATTHRYKNQSLIKNDALNFTISKDEGARGTYWKYGDINKYTRDMTFFPAIWDASGYMKSCYAKLASVKGSTVSGGTHAGGAAVMWADLIVKNGRGN